MYSKLYKPMSVLVNVNFEYYLLLSTILFHTDYNSVIFYIFTFFTFYGYHDSSKGGGNSKQNYFNIYYIFLTFIFLSETFFIFIFPPPTRFGDNYI